MDNVVVGKETLHNLINDDGGDRVTTAVEEQQKCSSSTLKSKYTRGNNVLSGLTHECGVFGAIGCGDWPTSVN